MEAAAETVEVAFEGCGVEEEGAREAEDLVVVDACGGLDFAAVGAEEWGVVESGRAGPAVRRGGHGLSLDAGRKGGFQMSDVQVDYFRRLFRYDRWANHEVLVALQAAGRQPADSVRWLAHLAGAGHTWLSRVKQEESPLAIWPELTVDQCEGYLTQLGEGWLAYLETIGPKELGRDVVYKNSRGEEFSTVLSDLFTQVLTHGAYHRGQIAANMRMNGETPAASDYIIAVRKGVLG